LIQIVDEYVNRDLIDDSPNDNSKVVERRVTLSPDSTQEEVEKLQDMVAGLNRASGEDLTVSYQRSDGRMSEGVDALEAMELDLDDIEVSGEDSDQEVIDMVGWDHCCCSEHQSLES